MTNLPPSPTSDDGGDNLMQIQNDNENIELSIGDIIWLKLESYPWWPAKLVDCKDTKIPSTVMKEKQSHLKLVKFFNSSPSEEYYWIDINKDMIKLFKNDPYLLDNNITVIKNNPNLKKAIHQAKQLCGIELPITNNNNNNTSNSNNNSNGKANEISNSKKRKNESEESNENKKMKDLVILTDEELNSIKEELSKSIESANASEIKQYLNFINDKCNQITVDQLKTCKIGQVVAQLRKHSDEHISKMAKDLVKTWTSLVSSSSNTTTTNTSNTKSEKTSATTPKKSSTTTPTTTSTTTDEKPKIKKAGTTTTSTTNSTTTTTKSSSTTTTNTATSTTTTKQPLAIKPIKTSSTTPTTTANQSSSGLKSPTTPLTPLSASSSSSSLSSIQFDTSKIPQCSETNRNRWRQKIAEGLSKVPNATEDKIVELSVEIEIQVYNYFKSLITATSTSYDDHCRTLSRNLNAYNNDDFRSNVYHSIISIEQLPVMKVQDMASKEKQKENALLQERKLHGSMVAKPAAVESSMFRCGKCKKTQCTFYEMQTRSADEPMTAFITCLSCGNRWKQ